VEDLVRLIAMAEAAGVVMGVVMPTATGFRCRSRGCGGSGLAARRPGWTLLDFQAPEADAERLAAALAGCLEPTGGWYVNYNTTAEAFVVFADRVFRYPRGDAAARSEVQAYARSVGVPEEQLDWED
jgi:hypothetical protein